MNTLEDYPRHIYGPIRRGIAERYIEHELRKLFPSLRDIGVWKTMDEDVSLWFNDSPTLLPVMDFWNGFDGVSAGLKLKKITNYLTSKNMRWSRKELPFGVLWFGTTFRYFRQVGEMPQAKAVRALLFGTANKELLGQARRDLESIEKQTAPRDGYPLIVTSIRSKYKVIDGNRRLLRAIIKNQVTVPVDLGEAVGETDVFEQWVPTQILLNMTEFHRYEMSRNNVVTQAIGRVIAEMIKDSSVGQVEWLNRCLSHSDGYDVRLWQEVRKIFKGWERELGNIAK